MARTAPAAAAWAPAAARAELEREVRGEPGLTGFEAQVTLRELDAGRLDITWQPKP